jgi:hypothetical protein
MTQRRQLTESEKRKVLQQHGRRCFVDGAPVPEDETVEFHHIRAFSKGGLTELDNIAPVCGKHHRTIGTMSLQEYRDKIALEAFFEDGEPKYLDDLIREKKGHCGGELVYEFEGNQISVYFNDSEHGFPLYTCPTTGWKYFYANLPVEYIENDRELQPRALRKNSLWNLTTRFVSLTGSIKLLPRFGLGTLWSSAKYISILTRLC